MISTKPQQAFESRRHSGSTQPFPGWFAVLTCLTVASTPLEDVLTSVNAQGERLYRSPTFYLGLASAVSCVFVIRHLARAIRQSGAMQAALASTAVSFGVLAGNVIAGNVYGSILETRLDRELKVAIFGILILAVAAEEKWARRLVNSYHVGGYAFLAIAAYQQFTGAVETTTDQGGALRISALGMNENMQSMVAGSVVVLSLARLMTAKRNGHRLIMAIGVLAGAYVFLFGASRTAMISLGIAVVFLVAASLVLARSSPSGTWQVVSVAILVALIAGYSAFRNAFVADQLGSLAIRTSSAFEGQLGERDVLAQESWNLWLARPWGVGLGQINGYLGGADPHNGYLRCLVEGGPGSFALLLAAIGLSLRKALKALPVAPGFLGAVAALLLFATGGTSGQALNEFPYWVFFGICASIAVAPSRKPMTEEPSGRMVPPGGPTSALLSQSPPP